MVTGGASGIGRALAQRAASGGFDTVLIDIDADAVAATADELGALALAVDVSERDAVIEAAARVARDVGDVHLLFNNAGVFLGGPFIEMPDAHGRFLIDVNLWGVIHGMQAFLPGMIERDAGHVVNTSSVSGVVTARNSAIYNAAKHAVVGLTESVFRELEAAGSRVGISLLCPGAVATGIVNSAKHWPDRLGPCAGAARGRLLSAARRADDPRTGRRDHVRGDRGRALLEPHASLPVRAGDARTD